VPSRPIVLLLFLREWRRGWSWWRLSGALAGAVSMLGFVVATTLTTAANAIFLVYTAPLYVALLSACVPRAPPPGRLADSSCSPWSGWAVSVGSS
jgi:drug/metabolite transporter (DMT)-like permease